MGENVVQKPPPGLPGRGYERSSRDGQWRPSVSKKLASSWNPLAVATYTGPDAVAERLVGDDYAKGMPTRVFASAVEGWVAEAAFFTDLRPVADDAGTLLRWRNASECTQSERGPYTIARKLGAGDPETLA